MNNYRTVEDLKRLCDTYEILTNTILNKMRLEKALEILEKRKYDHRPIEKYMRVEVTLEELYHGTEKNISFIRQTFCEKCFGFNLCGICHDKCPVCEGKVLWKRVEVTVKISSYSKNIIVKGAGNERFNYPPGDLNLSIVIKDHPIYKLSDNDLRMEICLTIPEMLCGLRRDLTFIDGTQGQIYCNNIEYGDTLRVKGKGFPGGDLLIMVTGLDFNLKIPEEMKPALAKILNYDFLIKDNAVEAEPEKK